MKLKCKIRTRTMRCDRDGYSSFYEKGNVFTVSEIIVIDDQAKVHFYGENIGLSIETVLFAFEEITEEESK